MMMRLASTTFLLLATLLLLPSCGSSSDEHTIPLPSMEGVEPDVVHAVREAYGAVVAAPDSAEAWGALGDRYAVHQFLESAVACYEHAEELDPKNYLWSYRLGWMRFIQGTGDALGPMERALGPLGSYYGPAHEAIAQILVREGRVEEAEQHFRRSIELDSDSPQAETGLGLIEMERGNLEAAREHLEAALERDPRHGEAHIALARVLTALGRTEEAREHAEASRSLPPFSQRKDPLVTPTLPPAGSTARTSYGKLLEQEGKTEEAADNYRIAVESNPHAAAARKRLAMLLVKNGKRDEAIALLREAEETGVDTEQTRKYLQRLLRQSR